MGFHVLVLAGGSGTRLWPLSRAATPKHLLPLAPGGRTLLEDTLDRVSALADAVHIVTAEAQADACRAVAGQASVIAEPSARGTGPALALAAGWIARDDPGALIASVHADARVADADAYRAAVVAGAGWARSTGALATVGLVPTHPATGLGYIELAEAMPATQWEAPGGRAGDTLMRRAKALPAFQAARFREKPSLETAEEYVADGRHLWNLGLFAWRSDVFLAQLEVAAPEIAGGVERAVARRAAGDELGAAAAYDALPPAAIEPLVLERGAPLIAVRAAFPWSDLGSWSDYHAARIEAGDARPDGNVFDGDVIDVESRDCTVLARGGRVVAIAGAQSLVVVDTPDALLVVPASQAQLVKDVVDRLRASGHGEV